MSYAGSASGASGASGDTRRLPPEYKTSGLLGAMTEMSKSTLALFLRVQAETGDVARLRFGPKYVYFVADPALVSQILLKDVGKFEKRTRGYEKLRLLLGNGLVTSEGDFWRRQRRIAQPAFRRDRIEGFVETFGQAAEDLADTWDAIAVANGRTDVAHAMMKATLRIAGETLFSADISEGSDDFGAALSYALEHFNRLVSAPVPWPEYMPTLANLKFWRNVRYLKSFTRELIEARRSSGEDHGDLLSMLMHAQDEETGETMSDQQLLDEVFTMLGAGHETTANALTWTLYLLSQHPEVAAKVAEENRALLGDRKPKAEELKQLTYTEQVFKESLRLFPPIWALARMASEDLTLGEYYVPKGRFVFFSQYAIHRHPKYWENPDVFDPERFSPERFGKFKENPHWRCTYFPFSQGQRKCIGDHFAMMEGVAMLSVLVRRFSFALPAGTEVIPEPTLTLRPKGGMPMLLSRRS